MQNGIIKLHPYCSKCGTVKNTSSDKEKKISYFVAHRGNSVNIIRPAETEPKGDEEGWSESAFAIVLLRPFW